jgi:hypothetical protein
MSIVSKTKEKKFERERSAQLNALIQRRTKWSDTDISFGPEDHPKTELSNRLALRGQALDRATQGGQDSGRQCGFTQPHNEEDFHRDEPQSSIFDPST